MLGKPPFIETRYERPMWPWGHIGVAYLLYWVYCRGRFRRPPRPEPAIAVLVGSQLPDVIDKPLAWWLGVFPTGRDLGHSLLFATVLIPIVYTVAFRYDRIEAATAFAIGHLSHLLADLPPRAFLGYPFSTEFLFWPIVSHDTFSYNEQLFEPPAIVELVVTPFTDSAVYFTLQIGLFVLAVGIWYLDGTPGTEYVRRSSSEHAVSQGD